ncbi:tripartite tricarboxylate transporter TctB family protein [Sphaerochaeta sp. S2]|uniref:tripartite tricarboxylate transporter TctB family protein n=1 Tax=Sphaerochaeta sp. S2 TaxID=2798868 RepID=UPI0018EA1C42|nr:tripartite tricarboxylate transporter TctB family protein [Sphaerochaeta sp. S2]MBJ2357680.1 tripartite tricarboxylate transporter TctB family protein [Sphaerochaeta sp. S2]
MKRNLESNLINLILILIGVALFSSALSIKSGVTTSVGGDFLPKIVTSIWIAVAVLLFISGLKNEKDAPEKMNMLGVLLTFFLLFFYIGMLKYLGFILCSMLYLGIQMILVIPKEIRNRKNYIILGVIAIVVPILTNLIFVNVFSLILPSSRLF